MSDAAVIVQHLSKKFSGSLKRAMIYGLRDIASSALVPGRRSSRVEEPTDDHLRPGEFWALRDVSFKVKPGECLGIIGHNGAGKSTLFSVISGIYGPSLGRVEVYGRLQALIALGAGFNPVLSGRENIYINAAILGMRTREIDALLEQIIDFAELADFIDSPVKNYSSGMLVRLGFSVAIHLRPDVLLIDEVLAVGDLSFQNKSFDRMKQLISSGIPVLFVSHWPQAVEMVATRVMWMDHGRVREVGEPQNVLARYARYMQDLGKDAVGPVAARLDDLHPIRISRVETLDETDALREEFGYRQPIRVRFHYECVKPVPSAYFQLLLRRPGSDQSVFCQCCMLDDGLSWNFAAGSGMVECRLESPPLAPGPYELRCGIRRTATMTVGQNFYHDVFTAGQIRIGATPQEVGRPGLLHTFAAQGSHPPVLLDHAWAVPDGAAYQK